MNTLRNVPRSDTIIRLHDASIVFVRLALSRIDAGQKALRSLLVDVPPKRWLNSSDESLLSPWAKARRTFDNGDVFLFCGWVGSDTVREWFARPDDCDLTGYDNRPGRSTYTESFALPETDDNVSEIQLPSFGDYGLPPIPYPSTVYTLQRRPPFYTQARDYEQVVGEDGEFFQNFRLAQAEVIFGDTDPNTAPRRDDTFAVRVVDGRGWLEEVRVRPDKVAATVGATDEILGKSFLVLRGAGLNTKALVVDHKVALDLPARIPNEVEVALLGGGKVIDSARFCSASHPFPHNSPQVVVEREDVFGYTAPARAHAPAYDPAAVTAAEDAGEPHPKVFISYSHDTPQHKKRVRDLADHLIQEGVECALDRYETNPSNGWQKWMEAKIKWADYVLVVCTETYCGASMARRSRAKVWGPPGKG